MVAAAVDVGDVAEAELSKKPLYLPGEPVRSTGPQGAGVEIAGH